MAVELALHLRRVGRVRLAVTIAVHRHPRGLEQGLRDRRRQRRPGIGHQFGVEGARNGQQRAAHAGIAQRLDRRRHPRAWPGDHALLRCVVVGNAHPGEALNRRLDGLTRALHRRHGAGHRAGAGLGHGGPTDGRKPEAVVAADGARGGQRHVFAIAVPGGGAGLEAQSLRQGQIAERDGADGRLRDAGVGERGLLCGLGFGIERGGRQDVLRQPARKLPLEAAVGVFQRLAHFVDEQCRFAAHVDVLRALAGKHKGHVRRLGRRAGVEFQVRRQRLPVAQMCHDLVEVGRQRGEIAGHQCQSHRRRATALGGAGQCQRQFGQAQRAGCAQHRLQLADLLLQLGGVGGAEHDQFVRPLVLPGRGALGTNIFFEHGVEVGAAKPEGRDPGAARVIGAGHPGTRLFEQVGGAVAGRQNVDRPVDAVMRRLHAVVQRQRHFDQPGHAGTGLGVAHQRLD